MDNNIEERMSGKNQDLKRNRFITLGEKRVNNALKAMKKVQNLSNKHNYTYDNAESKLIISTLQKALSEIKSAFEEGAGSNEKFKFPAPKIK